MIDPSHRVNTTHQFRYQFGDVLCFPLEKHERTWKFDTRNELGFYVGDKPEQKAQYSYTSPTNTPSSSAPTPTACRYP